MLKISYKSVLNKGLSIREIIATRSDLIDEALKFLWQHAELEHSQLGLLPLVVIRREMLPYSDVDIMILSEDDIPKELEAQISTFISSLWDVGNLSPVLVYARLRTV